MKVTNLQIDRLKPSPGQPLDRVKDVGSLAESIKVIGILNALTVRELHEKWNPNGSHYEIVAGHRRFAAARAAGLTEVPCVVVPVDADQAQIIRITENVHRVNLTPMQEAEAIHALAEALEFVARYNDEIQGKLDKEVGKLVWIKTHSSGSSNSGTKKVKGEKTAITDKDRAERLTNRRSMHLVQQVIELLRKKNAEPDGLIADAVADTTTVNESHIIMLKSSVAMALAFGLYDKPYDDRAKRKSDWDAVEEYSKSTPQDLAVVFWQRFAPKIAGELFTRAANGVAASKMIKDLPPLLKVMGVKIEDLRAKAAADIPDRHGLLAQKGKCRECGAKCDVRMTICGPCEVKAAKPKKPTAKKSSAKQVIKVTEPKADHPGHRKGVCRECGCTWTFSWADDSQTLCSFCKPIPEKNDAK